MNGNGVIRSGYPFGWGAYESTLVRGDGMYVFDQNGKRYLDLCSGLWNMPLGYSERRIKAVVNKQMEQLPFSNLLVFSSDIQTQYAQRLLQWTLAASSTPAAARSQWRRPSRLAASTNASGTVRSAGASQPSLCPTTAPPTAP